VSATHDRYHRQTLLPQIGVSGQARLSRARVLLVGCGALGTVVAEQLVRAGVGMLRIVDRDVVERSNLQRQTLFDEADADGGVPKAVAARRRLGQVNSLVAVEAVVADFFAGNAEELGDVDLILDGTDNVETRYLVNDLAVRRGVPWVYGACVGTEGRTMAVLPGQSPCLRCLFPQPPGVGELPTCDTAGVLGPVAAIVASLQSVAAIKLLSGNADAVAREMLVIDAWANRIRSIDVGDGRRADCVTCGRREFEFLDAAKARRPVSLCGRNAVQVMPAERAGLELDAVAKRLAPFGVVTRTPYLLRLDLAGEADQAVLQLTLFPDGRLIVSGTSDVERARSIYARYIGS
jgi:adenylyltransferase/sulfurtransferase